MNWAFDDFSQPHINRFDGVGGVYHLADFWRVVEERCDARPLPAPGKADRLVALVPLDLEFAEHEFGLLDGRSGVNSFQVGRHFFLHFPRNEVQAIAHHVHDTKLNSRFRIDRLDRIREAFESVNTGNEDVLHAPVFQLCDPLQRVYLILCKRVDLTQESRKNDADPQTMTRR